MNRFRAGLVFKAHELVYHSTLGLRVIKKKKRSVTVVLVESGCEVWGLGVSGLGFGVHIARPEVNSHGIWCKSVNFWSENDQSTRVRQS